MKLCITSRWPSLVEASRGHTIWFRAEVSGDVVSNINDEHG